MLPQFLALQSSTGPLGLLVLALGQVSPVRNGLPAKHPSAVLYNRGISTMLYPLHETN